MPTEIVSNWIEQKKTRDNTKNEMKIIATDEKVVYTRKQLNGRMKISTKKSAFGFIWHNLYRWWTSS